MTPTEEGVVSKGLFLLGELFSYRLLSWVPSEKSLQLWVYDITA